MKNYARIVAVLFIIFTGARLHAQCDPDTSCVDVDFPGEFCPRVLPEAIVDVPYEAVITVVPPGEIVTPLGTAFISHIFIDSVRNIPDGIIYEANADTLYADSAYCILISGIPTTAGVDTLEIFVTPWLLMAGIAIPAEQVVDDTSVVVTVLSASGLDPMQVNEFRVLPNVPNPFYGTTRIGFFTPFDDHVELQVFNILGEMLYRETQGFPPGEHHFIYDGNRLKPGTYFYRVSNHKGVYTGKFIKAKR